LLCVALAAAGVSGLGCGSDGNSDADKTTANAPTKTASGGEAVKNDAAIIDRAAHSAVAVKGEQGDFHSHGSGVIIDAARSLVLTSDHVVETATSLSVVIDDKREVKGRLVARAQCEDVALIALFPDQEGLQELKPADSSELSRGDGVIAIGYPGLAPTGDRKYESAAASKGAVSVVDVRAQVTPLLPPFAALIAHQAPLASTATGGPLIDGRGRFVGLNTVVPDRLAADGPPGLAYAVSGSRLRQLLGELQPGASTFYSGWEKYHRCHRAMDRLAMESQVANHDLPSGTKPSRGKGESMPGSAHDESEPHSH
jgi:S1-C subfamily serine protease